MEKIILHTRQVTFAGEDYKDTIWCNVLPMDSGDILLGRPCVYDKKGTHGMRDNTQMLVHNGKEVTPHSMKTKKPPKKGSRPSVAKAAL